MYSGAGPGESSRGRRPLALLPGALPGGRRVAVGGWRVRRGPGRAGRGRGRGPGPGARVPVRRPQPRAGADTQLGGLGPSRRGAPRGLGLRSLSLRGPRAALELVRGRAGRVGPRPRPSPAPPPGRPSSGLRAAGRRPGPGRGARGGGGRAHRVSFRCRRPFRGPGPKGVCDAAGRAVRAPGPVAGELGSAPRTPRLRAAVRPQTPAPQGAPGPAALGAGGDVPPPRGPLPPRAPPPPRGPPRPPLLPGKSRPKLQCPSGSAALCVDAVGGAGLGARRGSRQARGPQFPAGPAARRGAACAFVRPAARLPAAPGVGVPAPPRPAAPPGRPGRSPAAAPGSRVCPRVASEAASPRLSPPSCPGSAAVDGAGLEPCPWEVPQPWGQVWLLRLGVLAPHGARAVPPSPACRRPCQPPGGPQCWATRCAWPRGCAGRLKARRREAPRGKARPRRRLDPGTPARPAPRWRSLQRGSAQRWRPRALGRPSDPSRTLSTPRAPAVGLCDLDPQ